jgi:hypothetical protein
MGISFRSEEGRRQEAFPVLPYPGLSSGATRSGAAGAAEGSEATLFVLL